MTTTFHSDTDFPAAHSMDTDWFAVDRDGHVAVFDSGKVGAVPVETAESIGMEDDAVLEAVESLPLIAEPKFRLAGVSHPGLREGVLAQRRGVVMRWPLEGWASVLLFRDDSVLTPDVRRLPGLKVTKIDQLVCVTLTSDDPAGQDDPRWKVWERFLQDVAQARSSYVTSHHLADLSLALAGRGMFAYHAHDTRFEIAEPYGQVLVPDRPLRLDEAPRAMRDVLATRPRLDVSFVSAPYIQPAESVPCAAWGDSAVYLATDGFTVRPFPGADAAAYQREAAGLVHVPESSFKPAVFDPPLDDPTAQ